MGNSKLDDAAAVTLDVTTKIAGDEPPDGDGIRHDVFFNRGVIGSQAYAREFGNREPNAENPRSKEMRWLSPRMSLSKLSPLRRRAAAASRTRRGPQSAEKVVAAAV